jgi:hypothetical protein
MLWEVFMPNLRDNIADAFHAGIDSMFQSTFTNSRRSPRRGFSSSGISKHNPDRALRGFADEPRISDRDRSEHRLDVIAIDSRVEAEEVLHQMNLLIDEYDVCSLADFYKMVRISPQNVDYKFGWEELGNARVVNHRGEYYLDLPRPIPIKN